MSKDSKPQGFATRVIHAGQEPDPSTGAIMPPIYATSTFVQQSPGVHKGLDYGRSHNPTRWAFERCVADLESGAQAYAFASGMAAIATVLGVTNIMGSQITRDADGVLYTRAGLEIGVAATKTFVAQVAAMYLLALRLGLFVR